MYWHRLENRIGRYSIVGKNFLEKAVNVLIALKSGTNLVRFVMECNGYLADNDTKTIP